MPYMTPVIIGSRREEIVRFGVKIALGATLGAVLGTVIGKVEGVKKNTGLGAAIGAVAGSQTGALEGVITILSVKALSLAGLSGATTTAKQALVLLMIGKIGGSRGPERASVVSRIGISIIASLGMTTKKGLFGTVAGLGVFLLEKCKTATVVLHVITGGTVAKVIREELATDATERGGVIGTFTATLLLIGSIIMATKSQLPPRQDKMMEGLVTLVEKQTVLALVERSRRDSSQTVFKRAGAGAIAGAVAGGTAALVALGIGEIALVVIRMISEIDNITPLKTELVGEAVMLRGAIGGALAGAVAGSGIIVAKIAVLRTRIGLNKKLLKCSSRLFEQVLLGIRNGAILGIGSRLAIEASAHSRVAPILGATAGVSTIITIVNMILEAAKRAAITKLRFSQASVINSARYLYK